MTDAAEQFGFHAEVVVRWSDMDAFQHVNHARMVTLLEEARIPWPFADGRPTAGLPGGAPVDTPPSIVASTQIAAFDIDTQKLRRLTAAEREFLQRWRRD